jgi:DNA invertase Pin-like site-specific DNA recombinase
MIVYSMSRLSRDAGDAQTIRKFLDVKKCKLVVLDQPSLDVDTKGGKLVYGILAAVQENERDEIKSRISMAMRKLAKDGKLKTRPPFGYRSPGKKEPLERVEEEQVVIEKIKSLYAQTPNLSSICSTLMLQGIKPPGKCQFWYPQSVKRILKQNP